MHRTLVYLFFCQLILFIVVQSAECGSFDSSNGNVTDDYLIAEFELARNLNIGVIDARSIVDRKGDQRKEGSWRLNVLPGKPQSSEKTQFGFQDHPQVIVIFVHGFNTPPLQALKHGNSLWVLLMKSNDRLRATNKTVLPNDALVFFTFLWRGDFSATRFSTAQKAADVSSISLADVIVQLSRETTKAKIVIIAHSLGAHVALEALKKVCEFNNNGVLVDSLVLVQGAVLATSLYKWTVTDIISEIKYVEYNCGRYANSIQCAGHLLYTISEKDKTLLKWFKFDEKLMPSHYECSTLPDLPGYGDPQVRITAIGSPFDGWNKLEPVPEPQFPKVNDYGNRREPSYLKLPQIPKFAAMLYFTDWRIDHPNVQCLNISEDKENHADIDDWHSTIFDEAGLYILENIWRRVIDGIGLSRFDNK